MTVQGPQYSVGPSAKAASLTFITAFTEGAMCSGEPQGLGMMQWRWNQEENSGR